MTKIQLYVLDEIQALNRIQFYEYEKKLRFRSRCGLCTLCITPVKLSKLGKHQRQCTSRYSTNDQKHNICPICYCPYPFMRPHRYACPLKLVPCPWCFVELPTCVTYIHVNDCENRCKAYIKGSNKQRCKRKKTKNTKYCYQHLSKLINV